MSKPIHRIAGLRLQSRQMAFWRHHRKQFFQLLVIILVQFLLLGLLYQKANAQCSLFCNTYTNVALDSSCETKIWYDMILEDPYNPLVCAPNSPPSFQVIVMNQAGQPIGTSPYVTSDHIGQQLMVKVRHLPSMNSCWGQITIHDNLTPTLDCPKDTAIACSLDADPSLTGQIIATDCSGFSVNYFDQIQNFPCQPTLQRIIRTWQATDDHGHQSRCVQNIFIKRPELDAVSFPPNHDGIQSPAFSCDSIAMHPDWLEPDFTGFPTISRQSFSNGGTCTIGFTYEDQQISNCQGSFTVLRKWTIVDWCTATTNQRIQVIKVEDSQGPGFNLPDTLTVGTSVNCLAEAAFPTIIIDDNCSTSFQVAIFSPFGSLFQNGGTISGFPMGVHLVAIQATDDCGNSHRDTLIVKVIDGQAPAAICRTTTQVGLGSDGTALVHAALFDEGSYDNCCLSGFEIKHIDAPDADFAPYALLDCSQLGATATYSVKVMDCAGNNNYCTVKVNLKESLAPDITCPTDKILTCFDDPLNIGITGLPITSDNCGIDSTWHIDDAQTNLCHTGTIFRTWHTRDFAGNISSCVQRIDLKISGGIHVQFPIDIDLYDCLSQNQIHPDSLQSSPTILGQSCGQIGKNYVDDIFQTQSNACYLIHRKWKVVDWCLYDSSSGDEGWYEQVQTIRIIDTIPPALNCQAQILIDLEGADCTDTFSLPLPVAGDNCSQNISISLSGELGTDILVEGASEGIYLVTFSANDGCGNTSTCSSIVEIKDAKAPAAICNSMAIDLPASQELVVHARDFNAGSYDNCAITNELLYRIERTSNFTGSPPLDSFLKLDCQDRNQTIPVHFWVGDTKSNWASCQSQILVQDNFDNCPGSTNRYVIRGKIESTRGVPMENTAVRLLEGGQLQQFALVNHLGNFQMQTIPSGDTCEIVPFNNDNFLQGITTMDLVLLLRHYFGYQPFSTPELFIAADIDHNQVVDSMDIVYLRKCLLRTMSSFPDNTSWRFIDARHTYQQLNPLFDSLPEKMIIPLLQADEQADFKAIKVGDIDQSISNHATGQVKHRVVRQLELEYTKSNTAEVKAGFSKNLWAFQVKIPVTENENIHIHSDILPPGSFLWLQKENMVYIQYAAAVPMRLNKGVVLFEIIGLPFNTIQDELLGQELILGKETPKLEDATLKIINRAQVDHLDTRAYPNPSNGVFYLSGLPKLAVLEKINIWNPSRFLQKEIRVQSLTNKPTKADLSGLPTGIYWLELRFANYNPMKIAVFKW